MREAVHSSPYTAGLQNAYSLHGTQRDNFNFLFILTLWRRHLNVSRFSVQMSYWRLPALAIYGFLNSFRLKYHQMKG